MKVRVKTLSPIHIGNGERISSLEFLVDGGRLKVFRFDRILSAIERIPNPQLRTNAYLWFKNQGDLRLSTFLKNFNLNLEPDYELEINGNLISSQVEEFIKTLEGPYVPGSELKGSIRHLIACAWFMEKPYVVINKVKKLLNARQVINQEKLSKAKKELERMINKAEKELERMVFYSQERKDAQFDIMKALFIPDSQPLPYEYLRVEVPTLLGSNKPLYPCEAIKENVELEVEIKINKNAYEGLKRVESLPEVGRYFSDEDTFWNFLRECSQKFYSKLLDEEIKFFKNRRPDTAKHLESLKGYLNGNGVLLRIGKHEGILSTTFLLILKEKDNRLFDWFFRETQHTSRQETNKTRRINQRGLTFGWLLLERF